MRLSTPMQNTFMLWIQILLIANISIAWSIASGNNESDAIAYTNQPHIEMNNKILLTNSTNGKLMLVLKPRENLIKCAFNESEAGLFEKRGIPYGDAKKLIGLSIRDMEMQPSCPPYSPSFIKACEGGFVGIQFEYITNDYDNMNEKELDGVIVNIWVVVSEYKRKPHLKDKKEQKKKELGKYNDNKQ